MKNHQLDQFFKNKLDQLTPADLDLTHWEEAKRLLNNKKKNRTGLYFLILTGFILIWGSYYFISKNTENSGPEKLINPIEMAEFSEGENKSDLAESRVVNPDEQQKEIDKSEAILSGTPEKEVYNPEEEKSVLTGSPSLPLEPEREIPENPIIALEHTKEVTKPLIVTVRNPEDSLNLIATVDFQLSNEYFLQPGETLPLFREEKIARRRIGWSGTLLINPAHSNSVPVQGLTLGFVYEQYLKPNWFVGARPSLQLRTGEGGFSKFEQITTFGFSASNTTYGLKANNLQFVSVPVYLAGEFGRHIFEAGFSIDLLLGARGQLQALNIDDQVVSGLVNLNSGWIETDEMRQLSSNVFLGYRNTINNRLTTGLNFFYNPSKIYPGLPNQKNQVTNSKWYLGWQAIYYLK